MAAIPSTMMPLGTKAPFFRLTDTVSGSIVTLDESLIAKATLVLFMCNHCKYVKHIHLKLVEVLHNHISNGLTVFAISANDVLNFPEDAPDLMRVQAIDNGYQFPYLYDESQEVAKAYDAACTPDFFLFDEALSLVYRGQFDASRPSLESIPVTGKDLDDAIFATLNGQNVSSHQLPSIGCNVKWK